MAPCGNKFNERVKKMVVPIICWLSAFIIFIVLEAVTIQFVSIWFCFGTLAGLITTLFAGPVWLQIVMFVAVSRCV